MSDLAVRCSDCARSELLPWLPMLLAQTCRECAADAVAAHLEAFPGHRCEVIGEKPEPESKRTLKLLGKAYQP